MNRDVSNRSLMRDGSQNRLDDKQLGPAKMKAKVGTGIAYSQWPATQQQSQQNVGSGLPRAPSTMKPQSNNRMDTNYEDEDYEEGFDDADQNDGIDEMAKLKKAMDKEKQKA